jgi:hypothetical protein
VGVPELVGAGHERDACNELLGRACRRRGHAGALGVAGYLSPY